jgi:accessory colonization factor AcfC
VQVPAEQVQLSNKASAIGTEQDNPENLKKMEQLWAEGFKLYVAQDYEAAAEKLAEATELS